MTYTNSKLVTYKNISKNKTVNGKKSIEFFIPHIIVGQWTAKQGCDYFATTDRQCSANYVIGKAGDIGLSVEEKDRAFTSGGKDKYGNVIRVNGMSGADVDHRGITVEVASDTTAPYKITDKAWNGLVELAVDICKRYGKTKMIWIPDKNKATLYKVKSNEILILCHCFFANKSCPGEYLFNRLGELAETVNKRLADTLEKKPDSGVKAKDTVILANDAVQFNGNSIPSTYKGKEYTVREIKTDTGRAVLELNGVVMYAVHVDYLIKKQTEPVFKPGHEPSDYAKTAWKKAMDKGVFDGTNPKNNVTREQLAVILDRLKLI